MKTGIHPRYEKVRVTCVCGNAFETYSTKAEPYTVEICSACHPFYTGKIKLVDMAGRVEKFQKKAQTAEKVREEIRAREEARAVAEAARNARRKAQLVEKAETVRKDRRRVALKADSAQAVPPGEVASAPAEAPPPPAESSAESAPENL